MVGIPSFSGGSLGIGKTISGGIDTRLLFNDGGLLADNAALTFNKTTGVLSTTALSLGGATLGTNALAATGTANFSGNGTFSLSKIGDYLGAYSGALYGTTYSATIPVLAANADGVVFFTAGTISLGGNIGTVNVGLVGDAANVLAQRNGTNVQESRLYAIYASGTDYHRATRKFAKTTLSGVTGASVTATNLIPAGAVLVGLTTKVTTGLGVSNGTSGYQVGDGTDPDRWGAITGTAAGTSSDNRNWTAGGERFFAAANSVVITAVGGNFDGTGVIDVIAHYDTGECD